MKAERPRRLRAAARLTALALAIAPLAANAASLELRSILVDDQGVMFSIHNLTTGSAFWVGHGKPGPGLEIVRFDLKSRTLTVKANGRIEVLELSESMIAGLDAHDDTSSPTLTASPARSEAEARLLARAEAWAKVMEPEPIRVTGRRSSGFNTGRGHMSGGAPLVATASGQAASTDVGGATSSRPEQPGPELEAPTESPTRPDPTGDRYQVTPRRLSSQGRP